MAPGVDIVNLRRPARWVLAAVVMITALVGRSSAHVGGLGGSAEAPPVPFWLVALTGGGIVAVSFLFTSLMTDREALHIINEWRLRLPSFPDASRRAAGAGGVIVLGGVLGVALVGPSGTANAAVLFVWVLWWAGFTAVVYLVGNLWPVVNPWRALVIASSRVVSTRHRYDLGAWPAVVGLLTLVWIEVVSGVGEDPIQLAALIVAYTSVAVAGGLVYGGAWFREADPISRVFRTYGRMGFIGRGDRPTLRAPGAGLVRRAADGLDEVAFVVALLWVTSFDGLVSTPAWNVLARTLVGIGVPALIVYAFAALVGFLMFFVIYRTAARLSRRTADTYVSTNEISRRFVPSLVPIAAGYHLAHFLGYLVALGPVAMGALRSPLGPVAGDPVPLPSWFGAVELTLIVLGHLLAVWVAHAVSFDLFPGRLRPVRSQYPFVVVMVFYTMTSMWIVAQPYAEPAFL